MPRFTGGVSVNRPKHAKDRPDSPQRYLRISAGPLRNQYVHVLVMEAKLGRKLTPDETVEHLDGDGLNPDPDNLVVVSRSENTAMMNDRRKREAAVYRAAECLVDMAMDCGADVAADVSFNPDSF